jgi:iron complex outermembrane receptor protein
LFLQSEILLPYQFNLTIGGSLNGNAVDFERLSSSPPIQEERRFKGILSPRVALQKGITENLFMYVSFSQGFSPPTVAELYPSTNEFNQTLNPENGLNYELGLKSFLFKKKMALELVGYLFNLSETIVVRRDQSGADYFINAGETNQNGVEFSLRYFPVVSTSSFLSSINVWATYSLNDYYYKNFQQGVDDYSGNQMPGIAPNTVSAGLNGMSKIGVYANVTFQYTDPIVLNDANTETADPYTLVGIRMGFKNKKPAKVPFEIFFGVENLFDEKYSLGNDLNAFGGRYYNAAAPRNYYTGIKFSLVATEGR